MDLTAIDKYFATRATVRAYTDKEIEVREEETIELVKEAMAG